MKKGNINPVKERFEAIWGDSGVHSLERMSLTMCAVADLLGVINNTIPTTHMGEEFEVALKPFMEALNDLHVKVGKGLDKQYKTILPNIEPQITEKSGYLIAEPYNLPDEVSDKIFEVLGY